MDVQRSVTLIAAGAVLLMALLPRTSREAVEYLAFANLVGGMVIWLFAVLNWDLFPAEGHWFWEPLPTSWC